MKATQCTVPGCDRGGKIVRGMCGMHRARLARLGTTDLHIPTLAERLSARLVRATNGCLEWTGCTNLSASGGGYGVIGVNYKQVFTHRLAWELANGPIPDGLHVCHTCDNRICCDPDHLFLGTRDQNMADMVAKGRARGGEYLTARTHCPQGHPYDEANTYVYRGKRHCRACSREKMRRRNRERKEQQ